MPKFLAVALALTLPLTLFSQWTNLGTQSTPFAITSDYHGIRITNVPGPTPSTGSVWTAFTTDDDWVTETQRSTGGGGSLGCCTVEHIAFLDDSIGFAEISNMGIRRVHRTTDAGATWQLLAQGAQTSLVSIAHLQAYDDTTAFLIGHGATPVSAVALQCTPSGYQTILSSAVLEGDNGRIHFVTDSLGFVIVVDTNAVYQVLRTTDAGLTWATRLSVGIGNLRAIQFTDAQTGFVAGAGGVCYKSTDAGLTWNGLAVNGPVDVRAMHFLDDQVGYLACGGGVVLRTTDGGQFWANDQLDSNSTLVYVRAVSGSIAYVMDADKGLYKRNYIAGSEGAMVADLGIRVFPNPSQGKVTVSIPPGDALQGWRIWDFQGKLIQQGNQADFDISSLPPAIYHLQVQTRKGSQSIKIQRE